MWECFRPRIITTCLIDEFEVISCSFFTLKSFWRVKWGSKKVLIQLAIRPTLLPILCSVGHVIIITCKKYLAYLACSFFILQIALWISIILEIITFCKINFLELSVRAINKTKNGKNSQISKFEVQTCFSSQIKVENMYNSHLVSKIRIFHKNNWNFQIFDFCIERKLK